MRKIQSELIKYKRTITKKIILLAPLFFCTTSSTTKIVNASQLFKTMGAHYKFSI